VITVPRALVRVLDEVIDPDDVRVFHLGQELALGDCGRHGVRVAGVQLPFSTTQRSLTLRSRAR
jgi:hypothetical protein